MGVNQGALAMGSLNYFALFYIRLSFKAQIFSYTLLLFFFINCSNSSSYQESEEESASIEGLVGFEDGTYCAEINYYYSKTGTSSQYTLLVEIEGNELIKIYWPNGGWLDNSHFTPPDIRDGSAHFMSYEGMDYTVSILGKEGDCSISSYATSEDDLKRQYNQEQEDQYEEERLKKKKEQEEEDEEMRQLEEKKKQEEEEEQKAKEESDGN